VEYIWRTAIISLSQLPSWLLLIIHRLTETFPSRDRRRLIAQLSKPDSTSILLSSMLCAQQWVRERVSIKQTLCNLLQGQDFEQTISCVRHSVRSTLRKFKGIIQHWYVGLHWLSCFICISRSPTKSADQTLGSKLTAFHSWLSSHIFLQCSDMQFR